MEALQKPAPPCSPTAPRQQGRESQASTRSLRPGLPHTPGPQFTPRKDRDVSYHCKSVEKFK